MRTLKDLIRKTIFNSDLLRKVARKRDGLRGSLLMQATVAFASGRPIPHSARPLPNSLNTGTRVTLFDRPCQFWRPRHSLSQSPNGLRLVRQRNHRSGCSCTAPAPKALK